MCAHHSCRHFPALLLFVVVSWLTGCGGGSSSDAANPTSSASTSVTTGGSSAKPGIANISGAPITTVAMNHNYAFVPMAKGANGHALSFSVRGKPGWATFNTLNGALTGVPNAPGVFSAIVISVTDGITSATLPAFNITVASGTGGTTLAWIEPTLNDDGSVLTDLVGYHVYYGVDMNNLTNKVNIASSATTNYSISGLVSGTAYYFSVTAVNSAGKESAMSNIASQVI